MKTYKIEGTVSRVETLYAGFDPDKVAVGVKVAIHHSVPFVDWKGKETRTTKTTDLFFPLGEIVPQHGTRLEVVMTEVPKEEE